MSNNGDSGDDIEEDPSPSETGEDISNLTSVLKDLVTNLKSDKEPQRTINVTKVTQQTFRPDKIESSLTESPSTWLSKFKSWITVNKIDDLETIKHSFRLLMPDNELSWFDSLTITTRDDIFDSFVDYFQSKQPHWIIEQSLWNKTMKQGENLETYISDIQTLSLRLGKSDKETMAAFVRGLPPYMRMNVVQRDPKTFQEASQYARVCQEALNFGQPISVSDDIKAIVDRQQKTIDVLTNIVSTMNAPNTNQPEKCAAGQSNSPRVICQFCEKPNHTAKDCWQLKKKTPNITNLNQPRSSPNCDFCGLRNHRTRDCRKLRAEIKDELK